MTAKTLLGHLLIASLIIVVPGGCTHSTPRQASQGKTTLFWISVDGLRGDYVAAHKPPFLSSLESKSYYSTQLIPVFPSLTFPSHLSEATGVTPGVHGVTSNNFWDPKTKQKYSLPGDASLVCPPAEPIWLTAARQGVRTVVIDWPMSQHQDKLPAGVKRDDYSTATYDSKLTDLERLSKVAETYRDDFKTHADQPPLRLLMGYVHNVDSAGHKSGPDTAGLRDALLDTDHTLQVVVDQVASIFDEHKKPGDRLYVLITADHGMRTIDHLVSLDAVLGDALPKEAMALTSASFAQIYLNNVPESQRPGAVSAMLERLRDKPYLKAWSRQALPAKYQFVHPDRSGDVIIELAGGHEFTSRKIPTPVAPISAEPSALRGNHGYIVADVPEMKGFMLLCPYRGGDVGSKDVGEVDSLRLHPTAAKLLGIRPATSAKQPALDVR